MKRLLLLALLGLFLAGCGDKKVVRYYYNTVTDTVKVYPPDSCRDVPDCNENGNCRHDKEEK